jgi:hypothetical protein
MIRKLIKKIIPTNTKDLVYIKTIGHNNTLYGLKQGASKPFRLVSQLTRQVEPTELGSRFVTARSIDHPTVSATPPKAVSKTRSQFTISVDNKKTAYSVSQDAETTTSVLKKAGLLPK